MPLIYVYGPFPKPITEVSPELGAVLFLVLYLMWGYRLHRGKGHPSSED